MSRKGKLPIELPKGVDVKIDGKLVSVKGPKGNLSLTIVDGITVSSKPNGPVLVQLSDENSGLGKFHGLTRTLIFNMVHGVTDGFNKTLEMIGVGYRAAVQGQKLDLQIGTSHPVALEIPKDIQVKVEKNNIIHISGPDRQKVGQFAADVRAKKPPEPYQGKGIRYQGEYVRKKAGKAAAKSGK
ncbi:MAG: 50S ribosomal protein L6 [Parachlamydiaceae bacterium]